MARGKRAGARRAPRRRTPSQPLLFLLSLGVTLSVVAWGYLVHAAIDFGATARAGESHAWWLLAVASFGAVACLFVALMLVARILRHLGLARGAGVPRGPTPVPDVRRAEQQAPTITIPQPTRPARPVGHRAAR